jgi:hypothetical protein
LNNVLGILLILLILYITYRIIKNYLLWKQNYFY